MRVICHNGFLWIIPESETEEYVLVKIKLKPIVPDFVNAKELVKHLGDQIDYSCLRFELSEDAKIK